MAHEMNWNPPDSEENYKIYNSLKPNYTTNEITYSFNDDGYRCDSFSKESEFPILFMGCSFTEGVGLPLNEVWSYHFHKKISTLTNKNIPFWSLGKGGTSIDYAARCFYKYCPQLKPKYVFYLMSGISRREYSYESTEMQSWYPNPTPLHKSSDSFKTMNKVFCDPNFAAYQALRSAMILNSVASVSNTKIFIFGLDMDGTVDEYTKIELFKKFDNIEYFPIKFNQTNMLLSIPEFILNRPTKARDNSHPGAVWQYKMYNTIWELIKNKIG
jgi:hypothetical protein